MCFFYSSPNSWQPLILLRSPYCCLCQSHRVGMMQPPVFFNAVLAFSHVHSFPYCLLLRFTTGELQILFGLQKLQVLTHLAFDLGVQADSAWHKVAAQLLKYSLVHLTECSSSISPSQRNHPTV